MYSEVFNWLIQSSLKASLIILIVLFLRKFFKDKINAGWYMILWAIVTIRLILPWAPQTNTSMFNVLDLSVNVIQRAIITGENIENEIEKSKASINKSEHNKSEYFENHSEQDVDTYYSDISPDMNSDTQLSEASTINKAFDSGLNVSGHDISHKPQTPPLLYLIYPLFLDT